MKSYAHLPTVQLAGMIDASQPWEAAECEAMRAELDRRQDSPDRQRRLQDQRARAERCDPQDR
jgi:hypothetical protein